jgi:hypothetical protein
VQSAECGGAATSTFLPPVLRPRSTCRRACNNTRELAAGCDFVPPRPPQTPLYPLDSTHTPPVFLLLCSFEAELSAKNKQQASLTRQRLQLEKEHKQLQKQQDKKVRGAATGSWTCRLEWSACSPLSVIVPQSCSRPPLCCICTYVNMLSASVPSNMVYIGTKQQSPLLPTEHHHTHICLLCTTPHHQLTAPLLPPAPPSHTPRTLRVCACMRR